MKKAFFLIISSTFFISAFAHAAAQTTHTQTKNYSGTSATKNGSVSHDVQVNTVQSTDPNGEPSETYTKETLTNSDGIKQFTHGSSSITTKTTNSVTNDRNAYTGDIEHNGSTTSLLMIIR